MNQNKMEDLKDKQIEMLRYEVNTLLKMLENVKLQHRNELIQMINSIRELRAIISNEMIKNPWFDFSNL